MHIILLVKVGEGETAQPLLSTTWVPGGTGRAVRTREHRWMCLLLLHQELRPRLRSLALHHLGAWLHSPIFQLLYRQGGQRVVGDSGNAPQRSPTSKRLNSVSPTSLLPAAWKAEAKAGASEAILKP